MRLVSILLIFSIFSSLLLFQNAEAASSNISCDDHSDCIISGEYCINSLCKNLRESSTRRPLPTRPTANTIGSCSADTDCKTGQICNSNKVCVTPRRPIRPAINITNTTRIIGTTTTSNTTPTSGPGRNWEPTDNYDTEQECYLQNVYGTDEYIDSCPAGYFCRSSECVKKIRPNPELGRPPIYCGEELNSSFINAGTDRIILADTDPITWETCPYDGMSVAANSITIDCNNITIRGRSFIESGSYTKGVSVFGHNDVNVQNCVFEGFAYGVDFVDTESGEIINNRFMNIRNYAINLNNADSNHIDGNVFESDGAIYFHNSSGNQIFDNMFSGGSLIYLYEMNDITNSLFRNDFLKGNIFDPSGILNYCYGGEANYFSGSFNKDSIGFGSCGRSASRWTDDEVLGRLTFKCGAEVRRSLVLTETDRVTQVACDNTDGLEIVADNVVLDCNGHTIKGSHMNGISISGRTNVTIKNCILEGFPYGIRLFGSYHNKILNNNFKNIEDYALGLMGTAFTEFKDNIIDGSNGFYLRLTNNDNVIKDNYFYSNGNFIKVYSDVGGPDNQVYRNDFIGTGSIDDPETKLVYCVDGEGNYFSSGIDEDSAMIGGCEPSDSRWTTHNRRSVCSNDLDCGRGQICQKQLGGAKCVVKPIDIFEKRKGRSGLDILINLVRPSRNESSATPTPPSDGDFVSQILCLLGLCDTDSDGVNDNVDNCRDTINPDQRDSDSDGVGDMCDDTPFPVEAVCVDGEYGSPCGLLERCHEGECLTFAQYTDATTDTDGDGLFNDEDNCRIFPNPEQTDTDGNGIGDACEGEEDRDGDGIIDAEDNCQNDANPDQRDTDGDGSGDVCDSDRDGDGVINILDNCPNNANSDQQDSDDDRIGDICDPTPLPTDSCVSNSDCSAGQVCRDNRCQAPTTFPYTYERFDSPEKVLVIIDDLGQDTSDFEHPHANWVTDVAIQTPGSSWISQLETSLDFNFCSLPNWSCEGGYDDGQSYQCDGSGGSCVYSIPTLVHLFEHGIQFLLPNDAIRSVPARDIVDDPDAYYNFLVIPIDDNTQYNVNVSLGHWEDVSLIWDRPFRTRWSLYKEEWWFCDSSTRGWYEAIYTFPVGGTSSAPHTTGGLAIRLSDFIPTSGDFVAEGFC